MNRPLLLQEKTKLVHRDRNQRCPPGNHFSRPPLPDTVIIYIVWFSQNSLQNSVSPHELQLLKINILRSSPEIVLVVL